MLHLEKPENKPIKVFGKSFNPETPLEISLAIFIGILILYGVLLNFYAISQSIELYTGIYKFVGLIILSIFTYLIKKNNLFNVGSGINTAIWLCMNLIGFSCVLKYFEWPIYNTIILGLFSVIIYINALFDDE